MVKNLRALGEDGLHIEDILVRLLAVLAVLRELRNSDTRATWVAKGKTTVPIEERLRLFEEVMFTLFEGKTSILNLKITDKDFAQSEDVARLKGLLLWLAWDCKMTINFHKPFMEKPEEEKSRLKQNA